MQNDFEEFKQLLEDRKVCIIKQLEENVKDINNFKNSAPSDQIDFSNINTNSHIEETINKNLKSELKDIELSLTKIKEKNYGICELCDSDIDKERLKIKPHAKYCISCREIIEKGEK